MRALCLMTLLLCPMMARAQRATPPPQEFVPGQYLVGLDRTSRLESDLVTDLQLDKDVFHVRRVHSEGIYLVEMLAGAPELDALGRLERIPGVEYVEGNGIMRLTHDSPDPLYPQQWAMPKISAPAAWNILRFGTVQVIAVLDSGVDYTHPDLASNMWRNPGEIAGNGVDDDSNGFVDDVYGYDFVNNDSSPMDDNGHGTHCAGAIGAVGDSYYGVAGINWRARIMALKVADSSGNVTWADAAAAMDYARLQGVEITSNSYGGYGYSATLYTAFAVAANQYGMLHVCAAGNDTVNNDVNGAYPASFTLQGVISVAASTTSDTRASFSNYGAASVDLAAPGVNILSTGLGGTYVTLSGTSMACPLVAGAALLINSRFPGMQTAQLRNALLSTVDVVPGLAGLVATSGRLNLHAAMMHACASYPLYVDCAFPVPSPHPHGQAGIWGTPFQTVAEALGAECQSGTIVVKASTCVMAVQTINSACHISSIGGSAVFR